MQDALVNARWRLPLLLAAAALVTACPPADDDDTDVGSSSSGAVSSSSSRRSSSSSRASSGTVSSSGEEVSSSAEETSSSAEETSSSAEQTSSSQETASSSTEQASSSGEQTSSSQETASSSAETVSSSGTVVVSSSSGVVTTSSSAPATTSSSAEVTTSSSATATTSSSSVVTTSSSAEVITSSSSLVATSSSSGATPYCGDGTVNNGEECDDSNTVPGDGCDATCHKEASVQIADVRKKIHDASASPVTLGDLPIRGAVVSYVRPGIGTYTVPDQDGPGFFIQNAATGPALFFAMDPTGVAVGDVLDVVASTGVWLACGTCTAETSVYAVTQATFTKVGTGTLPAAQDLSADGRFKSAIASPVSAIGWELDGERVSITGVISGDFGSSRTGAKKAVLDTAGTQGATSALVLRVPDTVLANKGLLKGCTVTVHNTPLWHYEAQAQITAWMDADITMDSCPPLAVASTSPADSAIDVSPTAAISVVFSRPVTPASITGQVAPGTCSGSVQVSSDGFATCIGFASAAPAMNAANTAATFTPAPALSFGMTYEIKVLAGVQAVLGDELLADYASPNGFTVTLPGTTCSGSVVISQVYGGGGNTGAPFRSDFVELHNRGGTPVDVSTWSVQYTSAGGTTWNASNVIPLRATGQTAAVVIPAGGYFLVKAADGAGTTMAALPTPDAVGTTAMGATAGKVALSTTTTPLTGATPVSSDGNVVDRLAWGSNAAGMEGTAGVATSNLLALIRKDGGCADTDDNGADFEALTPTPRNTAAAVAVCGCGTGSAAMNESGNAKEADYCAILEPLTGFTVGTGQTTPAIKGRIYEAGLTPTAGAQAAITAQVGFGPVTANPEMEPGWTWFTAAYDQQFGNDDGYTGTFTAPAPGNYFYTYRFSLDGTTWTYCDSDGAGSNNALYFDISRLPAMAVTPGPTSFCGDGTTDATEECDDGNRVDTDDCTNACKHNVCGDSIQDLTGTALEECDHGASNSNTGDCTATCKLPTCGDGFQWAGHETCDDHNANGNDGCSAACAPETGFTCTGSPSVCATTCGDGIKAGTESCDDHNTTPGDGCSASCAPETGFACSATSPSVCTPVCGDGLVLGGEQCDDQNTRDGDGCSALCIRETGYTCTTTNPSLCATVCGDGLVVGAEGCDDTNVIPGDGCSATCTAETGYTCVGTPSICGTLCGDGVQAGTEACDDHNTTGNDGCSSTCTVEAGFTCTGSAPTVCSGICGDGFKVASEGCDDHNTVNGDGCTATCTVEPGYTCTGSPSVCSAGCGDGIKAGSEQCDDGNANDGDGCSSACLREPGYTCTGQGPGSCSTTCGDAVKAGTETCDDGNTTIGDGCSITCQVESGWTCTGQGAGSCSAICGDGRKLGTEQCDDGNTANGDGCSVTCTTELGYSCTGTPSVCTPPCGDGIRAGAETCDDGNNVVNDGCSSTCQVETGWTCTGTPSVCAPICGDTLVVGTEECDRGAANADTGDCTTQCKNPTCGDSFVWAGHEGCDLGALNSNTGDCTTLCQNATCGDGHVWAGHETCDDGNAQAGDGCFACAVEDPTVQIGAIRAAIQSAAASTVTLDHYISDATVTYVKAASGTAPAGDPDGPGFTIQSNNLGPAIFVAMDPAALLGVPALAAGDVVRFHATQGAWKSCSSCTANNSMYAITAANAASVMRSGAPLPTAQILSGETTLGSAIPTPAAGSGGWVFEHERVTLTGNITDAWVSTSNGLAKATLQTTGTGTTSTALKVRADPAVIIAKSLVAGCNITVHDIPMWRYNTEAQPTAWVPADITVNSGCPALSITANPTGSGLSLTSPIVLAFTRPMDSASLTAQTTPGACTGNIQVSTDNFATCIGFAAAAPSLANYNMTATLTPAPLLSFGSSYQVRVKAAAKQGDGTPVGSDFTAPAFSTQQTGTVCDGQVVISQVFGGGGTAGYPKNDFIELHNRGASTVSLVGWSVQYASSAGTSWSRTDLTGSIDPGGYYLVQEAAGAAGNALPTPDAIGAIAMSGTAAKVALVKSTTNLVVTAPATCPSSPDLMDLVAYGAASTCGEGGSTAPAPSTTTSIVRGGSGCNDTNSNSADFVTSSTITARNRATAAFSCGCASTGTVNESNLPEEMDWCTLQWVGPAGAWNFTMAPGATSPVVYARLFESGYTTNLGQQATVLSQLGVGPISANPSTQSALWTWTATAFSGEYGNDDEYMGSFVAPATAGTYSYTARMSRDSGTTWTYCDINGAGSNAGLAFEVTQLPILTVQ